MKPIQSVSVLMPIYQGATFLERVLAGLASQRCEVAWEFRAADCGSTDGTLEIFESFAADFPVPFFVHHILGAAEFNHGDTRNLLASCSTADLCVFITDDAIPVEPTWLERLVANYADPEVAAAYCRNIPRPEADVLTRAFSLLDKSYASERREERWPADWERWSAFQRRLHCNYTDTCSSVRRELWERHPYPRCAFGEDVLLARALMQAGYKVVFDDRAQVYHSHEYDPQETRRRTADDARFNAERMDWIAVPSPRKIDWLVAQQVDRDRRSLIEAGLSGAALERELEAGRAIRRAFYEGVYEGGRSTRRFGGSQLLADPTLRFAFLGEPQFAPAETLAVALEAEGLRRATASEAELVHVFDDELPTDELERLVSAEPCVLVQLTSRWEQRARSSPAVLRALERADLCVTGDPTAKRRWLGDIRLDPEVFAYAPPPRAAEPGEPPAGTRPSDAPASRERARPRSLLEAARELAFRYRGLRCRTARIDAAVWRQRATHADPSQADPRQAGPTQAGPTQAGPGGAWQRADWETLVLQPGARASFALTPEQLQRADELTLAFSTARSAAATSVQVAVGLPGAGAQVPGPLPTPLPGHASGVELGPLAAGAMDGPGDRRHAYLDWRELLERSAALGSDGPLALTICVPADAPAAFELQEVALWERARRLSSALPGNVVWERAAARHVQLEGPTHEAAGSVQLGPDLAAVEFDLDGAGHGPRELCLFARGEAQLGLRVLVDGRVVGSLQGSPQQSETAGGRALRVRLELEQGSRRLRIENRASRSGAPCVAGLERVVLRVAEAKAGGWRAPARRLAAVLRSATDRPPLLEVDSWQL